MATSKEVQPAASAELVSLDDSRWAVKLEALELWCAEATALDFGETDPEEISAAICRRILTSDDPLAEQTIWHAEDLCTEASPKNLKARQSKPLRIIDFEPRPSTLNDGDAYVLVGAYDHHGDPFIFSCGGRNVVTQLVRKARLGQFPFDAVIESVPTNTPGRSVLWLRKAEYQVQYRMMDESEKAF